MFASTPSTCTRRTLDLPLKDWDIRYLRYLGNSDIAQFSTVVTPALGAGHPVDRVHRSRVPGGNPRFSPKISEVKATDQQRPAQAPQPEHRRPVHADIAPRGSGGGFLCVDRARASDARQRRGNQDKPDHRRADDDHLELVVRLCCNFRAATSGWTTFGKHRTGSPIMPSDNPFKWRQFEPALILQCVRWYLRYALSYRDLEDMMRERGLCVDHTTIYRWVQRYAPEIDKRCRPFLRRTNDSYRIDETDVRVAGAWTYLYRGVDSNGDTLDFLLRATRDRKAAIAFFRKTLGAAHTTPPRVVTVDKNPAYPVAFEAVRHEGLVRPRSNFRQCKYLNNIIEQDHRFIKRRTRPMLGFKRFTTAWRTLRGIEIMHALRKGQARWMAKGDVVGQTQLIHKVFGLAA